MVEQFQADLNDRARRQGGLLTRGDVVEVGGGEGLARGRVRSGLWERVQAGVYVPAGLTLTWEQRLLGAVLAAGPTAVASHRAAYVLWGLDGLSSSPAEITVAYTSSPVPEGVIRHRTRRAPEVHVRSRVPCTSVERTLIDVGRYLPTAIIERGVEDAIKRGLTTHDRLATVIEEQGGRGVPGAGRVRRVVQRRPAGARAAGSPAEVRFLQLLRRYGLPDPVRQFVVVCRNGQTYVVDMAWPEKRVLVEIDGLGKRWDAAALDQFLERQNAILEMGYILRRYGWRAITERADDTARRIAQLVL